MSFFKEQWGEVRRFYRGEFAYFLRITAIAFLIIIFGSFAVGMLIPSSAEGFVGKFLQNLSEIGVVGEDYTIRAGDIFANNLRATITGIVYGLLPLLHLPALSLGINASLLGLLGAYYANNGTSLWLYLVGILPHGIFELPALVISLAMGLYLCRCTTRRLLQRTHGIVKPALLDCSRILLLQVTPLLLLASFIEVNITPNLLKLFS